MRCQTQKRRRKTSSCLNCGDWLLTRGPLPRSASTVVRTSSLRDANLPCHLSFQQPSSVEGKPVQWTTAASMIYLVILMRSSLINCCVDEAPSSQSFLYRVIPAITRYYRNSDCRAALSYPAIGKLLDPAVYVSLNTSVAVKSGQYSVERVNRPFHISVSLMVGARIRFHGQACMFPTFSLGSCSYKHFLQYPIAFEDYRLSKAGQ